MDNMLPSPSLEDIDIGTPHHPLEEDQMIAPSAQEQQNRGNNVYSFGFTPQNMLSSGSTPHNLLGSTPHNLLSSSGATPRGLDQGGLLGSTTPQQPAHHYAPVPTIPAPPSPAMQSMPTPVANDIVPQLQNIVSTVNMGCILDLKEFKNKAKLVRFY